MYATVVVTTWGRQMERYNFAVEKQVYYRCRSIYCRDADK